MTRAKRTIGRYTRRSSIRHGQIATHTGHSSTASSARGSSTASSARGSSTASATRGFSTALSTRGFSTASPARGFSTASSKRKWTKTPIKSPFKSPLFLATRIIYSPAKKKVKKTVRPLFQPSSEFDLPPDFGITINNLYSEPELLNLNSSQTLKDETSNEESTKLLALIPDIDDASFCLESDLNNQIGVECSQNLKDEILHQNTKKLLSLVPGVMDQLSQKDGMDSVMVNFFQMVEKGFFPLDNIAFLLWIEVVRWFSFKNTSQMRYSDQTKLFWKLGWRLFGSRFLNYMGGYKSHGELVLEVTERGYFDPESADVNFAVPSEQVLRTHEPYGNTGERKPGVYDDVLSMLSDSMKYRSACLTFDGKKIKQGLTPDSGDVDLLGFEKGHSLSERKALIEKETDEILQMEKKVINSFESNKGLTGDDKQALLEVLNNCLTKLSTKVNEMMVLRERKEYCKKKLIERSGGADWKKGRLSFAISSVTAFIYEIDEFMNNANTVTVDICKNIARLNNASYVSGEKINLNLHERYASVEFQKDIEGEGSTRLMKQRSEEWFDLRKKAVVTGSTIYKAAGCDSLARQKDHFEKVVCGVEEKQPSDFAKAAMKHGSDNEINAVGTIVGKIIPVLKPELIFCEEGCSVIHTETDDILMVVSPDGSLRTDISLDSTKVAVEIKCPVNKVHTVFPGRYLLQCLSQMYVLDVQELLYVSWTCDVTTVFQIARNDTLLAKAIQICQELFCGEKTKKPTRLSESTKLLTQEIQSACKHVKFVGRFPSLKVEDVSHTFDMENLTEANVCQLLTDVVMCYRNWYDLQREKASEAVVFLVADLDRSWRKDQIRCSPVAWFPKGYSLDSDTMRAIAEHVHTACWEKGIHVPCESFDGQWHLLVVRDTDGSPLTAYQLQKDIWKSVEKMSKKEIVANLIELNKTPIRLFFTEVDFHGNSKIGIVATNGGLHLPAYRHTENSSNSKTDKKSTSDTNVEPSTLAHVLPEIMCERTEVGLDVLAQTPITDSLEIEAFAHTTDGIEWCLELENVQSDEPIVVLAEDENERRVDWKRHDDGEKMDMCVELDRKDMECIISMLQTTNDCNKKGQWDGMKPELFRPKYFTSYENLDKLREVDLKVVVRYLKKTKNLQGVLESGSRRSKVDGIAKFLGFDRPEGLSDRKRVKKSPVRCFETEKLNDLCTKVVSKYSKHDLNVIFAEYIFPGRYKSWVASVADITVDGEKQDWYYKPAFSNARRQFEVKCIDSTHLLTRTRRKTCAGGIEGMTNKAWTKVAKQKTTLLTPIMVEEITDPMSVSMAKTHFSESVESEMRKNRDHQAADLVRDVRNWWYAEDIAGIPASRRIEMRQSLRRRLLSYQKFTRFPPPTQYVHGWPAQLCEALIANIDAKAYLYSMVHGGTYNVRAFSSLIGETFFSELTVNDKRGQGTVSAVEFGQFIGNVTEQVNARLDDERKFAFCTSKKKVYSTVDESENELDHSAEACWICQNSTENLPKAIQSRGHPFDKIERKRLHGRRKRDHIYRQKEEHCCMDP